MFGIHNCKNHNIPCVFGDFSPVTMIYWRWIQRTSWMAMPLADPINLMIRFFPFAKGSYAVHFCRPNKAGRFHYIPHRRYSCLNNVNCSIFSVTKENASTFVRHKPSACIPHRLQYVLLYQNLLNHLVSDGRNWGTLGTVAVRSAFDIDHV